MTRSELRETLSAFRAMVRERGPRECLEVSQVLPTLVERYDHEDRSSWFARCALTDGRLAALAALRWWRWANRGRRYVLVREVWGKTDEDIWYEDLYF